MSLVLWLFIYTLLLFALRAMVKSADAPWLKLILAPAVLLAIVVRALACAIGKAEVEAMNPPWRAGPPIRHKPPKIAFYGPLALAVLPLAACMAALLFAARELDWPLRVDVVLPDLEPGTRVVEALGETSVRILSAMEASVEHLPFGEPRFWIFFWLAAAIHLYLAPTALEWRSQAFFLGVAALACAAIDWLGLSAGFLTRGWYLRTFYGDPAWDGLSLLIVMAFLGLVLALLGRTLRLVVGAFGRKSEKR